MHGLKRRGLETEPQPPRQSPTLLSDARGEEGLLMRVLGVPGRPAPGEADEVPLDAG